MDPDPSAAGLVPSTLPSASIAPAQDPNATPASTTLDSNHQAEAASLVKIFYPTRRQGQVLPNDILCLVARTLARPADVYALARTSTRLWNVLNIYIYEADILLTFDVEMCLSKNFPCRWEAMQRKSFLFALGCAIKMNKPSTLHRALRAVERCIGRCPLEAYIYSNHMNKFQYTPLMLALTQHSSDFATQLLSYGLSCLVADGPVAFLCDLEGLSDACGSIFLIDHITIGQDFYTLRYLVRSGGPPTYIQISGITYTPLARAIANRDRYNAIFLASMSDIEDVRGTLTYFADPMHLACLGGMYYVVEALIRRGRTCTTQYLAFKQATPLHFAAAGEDDNVEVMQLLLENGADPAAKDNMSRDPLIWAIRHGRPANAIFLAVLRGKMRRHATRKLLQLSVESDNVLPFTQWLLEDVDKGLKGAHLHRFLDIATAYYPHTKDTIAYLLGLGAKYMAG